MTIYNTQLVTTKRVLDKTVSSGLTGVKLTIAGQTDYDGATAVDGILLDPYVNREDLIGVTGIRSTAVQITAATDDGIYKGKRRFTITPASEVIPQKNEAFTIGSFAPQTNVTAINDLACFVQVKNVIANTSPKQFLVETAKTTLTTADIVGKYLYRTHSFNASVVMGYMTMNLGTAVTGRVRVALISTTNPTSGATYTTREAANEVIWSKAYPLGTQINVDFSGLSVSNKSIYPPLFDCTGTGVTGEPRIMICLYGDSTGGAATPSFELDADITYTAKTVVDTNG